MNVYAKFYLNRFELILVYILQTNILDEVFFTNIVGSTVYIITRGRILVIKT